MQVETMTYEELMLAYSRGQVDWEELVVLLKGYGHE